MADLDLGKQIGPLPLGAWIAVVGTGVGIAAFTRRQNNAAPVVATDTSGIPGVGTGAVGGWTPTAPVIQTPTPATPIATNEEWGVAAINFLIAFGTDAAVADMAIRKYLAGSSLNLQETALLKLALVKLGSPPVPLPPGGALPKPPTTGGGGTPGPSKPGTPVSPKPAYKYRTVKPWPSKESTLAGISMAAYGTNTKWREIYNANRAGKVRPDGKTGMIVNQNTLRPGWVLLIP